MYFPPQLGHLLDPCDNSFHASVHKRYWHIIDNYKKISLIDQIFAIHKAYFAEKESSVKEYFEKCGITGTAPPHQVLEKLFHEGVYPTKKFCSLHESQLKAYLKWRWNGKKSVHDVFGAEFSKLFPQKR